MQLQAWAKRVWKIRLGARLIETRAPSWFRREFDDFARLSSMSESRFALRWEDRFPCLGDRTNGTGFDRHYVYHTAWAARVLARTRPQEHVDISSSLYFCGIASAFVPIRFYDYRPADLRLNGLTSEAADLMSLPFADGSLNSLSCMHVVEHIGLGRYGDPLDPQGDLKAIRELKRVTAVGGALLLVVPVGRPKIAFNAHRVYSYEQMCAQFEGWHLGQFALIPDDPSDGGLVHDAAREMVDKQTYGCGCFWWIRTR